MTVNTSYQPVSSACNGVSTSFPVAFQYAAPSDLIVELIDTASGAVTLLVEGVDYTRTGGGMAAPSGLTTATAYPTGKTLRRRRVTAMTQNLDMVPNVGAPAEAQELAWDRGILIEQEARVLVTDTATRALLVPPGETAPPLPAAAARANTTFNFDGAGNPFLTPIVTLASVASAIAAGLVTLSATISDGLASITGAKTTAVNLVNTTGATQIAAIGAAGALFDPASLESSNARWLDTLKTIYPGNYVDAIAGNDARATGTLSLPIRSLARAFATSAEGNTPIMLNNGQVFRARAVVSSSPTFGAQFGNIGLSGLARNCFNYGTAFRAPLIDARQSLAGKTWTLLSGSSNTWGTTATLAYTLWGGIEQANGSKHALYLDASANDIDPTTSLHWVTNNANVAANDTIVKATAGTWSMNVVGSTLGDIRNVGGGENTSSSVEIKVHLPDGSNPNGKPLWISDMQAVVTLNGGSYGHLRFVGGASKDSVSFSALNKVIPTLQSYEAIDFPCHGGVGPRNVLGLSKIHLRPLEGESVAANGQTFGVAHHLFCTEDLSDQDITIGALDLANGGNGLGGHGAFGATWQSYKSVHVLRRSKIVNCNGAVSFDGGPVPRVGFTVEGIFLEQGVDIVGGISAFSLADDPILYINGGSWTPAGYASATCVTFVGSNNTVHLRDFVADASAVSNAAPGYYGRGLYNWNPYYGYSGSTPSTLILENFTDASVITSMGGKLTCGEYPAGSEKVNLDLRRGTTLGDLVRYPSNDIFPNSFTADASAITFGWRGMTRAAFRAGMAALGRACTMPNSVKMVDRAGTVVDAAA